MITIYIWGSLKAGRLFIIGLSPEKLFNYGGVQPSFDSNLL